MDSATLFGLAFFVAGALLLLVELHSLTIYLLAVALGLFAAGGASTWGMSLDAALVVLALVVALGVPLAHLVRGRLKNRASERVSHDDVGHDVVVVSEDAATVRVAYRGSTWNARFVTPEARAAAHAGGRCTILRREGSLLVLDAHRVSTPPPDRPRSHS